MSENAGLETELKLELRPEDAARVGRLKALPHARLGLPKAEQIVTVYYDTADHALRHAGLTLRLRHAGTRRLQTVKSTPLDDGITRLEDEVPVNGAGPELARIGNAALREQVLAAAGERALEPIFETIVLRTTRHIRTDAGGVIEFVVDLGEVRAATDDCPISELELELKSGAPAALFDLAQAINESVPLRLVRLSKSDRGYALLNEALPGPQKARAVKLAPDASAGDAVRTILENCLTHLLANEPHVVERRDVEGLHQLRVAQRRLRAVLSTYKSLLDEGLLDRLEHEIRGIGAICGDARDYDVFVMDLLPAAEEALSAVPGGRAAIEQGAKAARADAWAKVVEAVASARFTALALSFGQLATAPDLPLAKGVKRREADEPARDFAARALDRHLKKSAKLASDLGSLDDVHRHRLRKRLKRLRYAAEFFASLWPEDDTKRYLKRLGALQDCFGSLNDLTTAERLVGGLSAFGNSRGADPALIAEAGEALAAYHRELAEQMIAEAGLRWEKLIKRKPFWHSD